MIKATPASLLAGVWLLLCNCCAAALFILRYLATTYVETKRSGVETTISASLRGSEAKLMDYKHKYDTSDQSYKPGQ